MCPTCRECRETFPVGDLRSVVVPTPVDRRARGLNRAPAGGPAGTGRPLDAICCRAYVPCRASAVTRRPDRFFRRRGCRGFSSSGIGQSHVVPYRAGSAAKSDALAPAARCVTGTTERGALGQQIVRLPSFADRSTNGEDGLFRTRNEADLAVSVQPAASGVELPGSRRDLHV